MKRIELNKVLTKVINHLKLITINLAPADIKKEGSSYDLPIAIGILAASGVISQDHLDDFVILGELSFDGSLRPIHAALPIALEISKNQHKGRFCQ